MATTSSNNGYDLPSDAVWLITGCSSGLGLNLAQLIASHPTHRLVATARNPSRLENALPSNSRVLVIPLDVDSSASITSALDKVLNHPCFGRIDVLVNNAGYGLMGDTESSLPYSPMVPNSSDEEHSKARGVVETDFWGTAMMTLHAIRIMRENNARNGKQGGMVIQITSMGGYMAFPGNAYYHAAKFAVEGFTESVRREVRPEWNIHFTIAEPGGIDTNYATSSMATLAKHPAYDAPDSPARMLAAYVDNPEARKSWSRPDAMSNAIYEMASRGGKPVPVRFPLGAVAWGVLRAKAESTIEEFDQNRSLSVGVDGTEQSDEMEKVKDLY